MAMKDKLKRDIVKEEKDVTIATMTVNSVCVILLSYRLI